ncbi:Thioesterase/thiol ester dehydrase-isomerase [Metschnikowia bicuspidata var. bicuspidata NRRL YB-4993]|uniref:Thioesterase/thiol ester dehydrase-isomerase n=1 Tax=Metschnikowia bicuspidata var. bicuspidata NRRL YB-4993 TaxID=869754 RepID=A0A1A0HG86_9ASCO|nr:Thioesterase/thiol ester dehydrase-isomerase [Metschnikowia bicuspidata var. bicuspidata NRRL YB-4993]OBA22892.1 Thioesterase/thiol ester dehydrase-isomerase [Metschnikowia bicuspidata var. bicuspidata NRRL YB-4993]
MSQFQDIFSVRKTGKNTYIANHPLTKAHPSAKGVYGGNIVGQAVLVAIKSAPKGFTPHSVHSYFAKIVSEKASIEWEVDEISNGNNFCGRCIRAVQKGETKFTATISLARKNSLQVAELAYQQYEEKERLKIENRKIARANGKLQESEEVEEEDDEPVIDKPFQFQVPYPEWLKEVNIDDLLVDRRTSLRMIYHKIPTKLVTLKGSEEEDNIPATDRRVAWFVRLGLGDVEITDSAYQFSALAVLSDSMFLTRIARVLRIPDIDLSDYAHYFSVSLDHTIFFHDTDFDATEWMGFAFKAIRYSNGRFLLEAQMYNSAKQHVATVFQEGLAHFNGIEREAKI